MNLRSYIESSKNVYRVGRFVCEVQTVHIHCTRAPCAYMNLTQFFMCVTKMAYILLKILHFI